MFKTPSFIGGYKEIPISSSILSALSTISVNLSSLLSITPPFPPGNLGKPRIVASQLVDNADNVMLALLLISSAPRAISAICCL
jgi:hypothetical protein